MLYVKKYGALEFLIVFIYECCRNKTFKSNSFD